MAAGWGCVMWYVMVQGVVVLAPLLSQPRFAQAAKYGSRGGPLDAALCISVCKFVCVCLRLPLYVCMYVCKCVCVCVCVSLLFMHTYVFMPVCICVYLPLGTVPRPIQASERDLRSTDRHRHIKKYTPSCLHSTKRVPIPNSGKTN